MIKSVRVANVRTCCAGNKRRLTVKGQSPGGLWVQGRFGGLWIQLAVGERHRQCELRGALDHLQHAPMVADWGVVSVCVISGVGRGETACPSPWRRWTVAAIPGSGAAALGVWNHRAVVELHAPRPNPSGGLVDQRGEVHLGEMRAVRAVLGCVLDGSLAPTTSGSQETGNGSKGIRRTAWEQTAMLGPRRKWRTSRAGRRGVFVLGGSSE